MRRVGWWLAWLAGALLAAASAAWWLALPRPPGAFYDPPAEVPAGPGALLRQEPFEVDVPPGAAAWRILYTTTRSDGSPAVASAIVMASRSGSDRPRPAVLWTHGTTGVERGCAPPLIDAPFANVPALQPLVNRGWVYVGPDYVGQGTAGPHPYLVGEGEARSALDALRAARRMRDLALSGAAVVWGHSQGGHAALWTGILAPGYAPELSFAGVAAAAPASDLPALLEQVQHAPVGRIMSSYVLRAYGETYPDVRFEDYAHGLAGWLARDMARRCLAGLPALASAAEALLAGGTIFSGSPTAGALGRRLKENIPDGLLAMPVFIGQGGADELVLPAVQSRFVKAQCARGQSLRYAVYDGRDHVSVVAPDSPLVPDLVAWTADRFAGKPAAAGCTFDAK